MWIHTENILQDLTAMDKATLMLIATEEFFESIIAVKHHRQFELLSELKMFLKNLFLWLFWDIIGYIVVESTNPRF